VSEKDPDKVRLGNRIRELREQAGLSREQLGAAAGLSARAVQQWELGDREPGWFNMVALADALGVSCEAFRQESGPAPEPQRGRPRKVPPAEAKPKRPRGRPRKTRGGP
jgi:transcriptional regulator with XRE-family HTH domain